MEKSSALAISDQSTKLPGMVQEMMFTVRECHGLAEKCMVHSYGGKLFMQSNLDMILTKLHCHVKNLSVMCKISFFPHGYAIVVSKRRLWDCKEDMRFYVKNLLTRTKIEQDPEMKRQALASLHKVANDDQKFVVVRSFTPWSAFLILWRWKFKRRLQECSQWLQGLIHAGVG
ncbi:hypothetical protein NL676_029167 [Syzygium grande]|nr:hypothetical protein NL676_029167 [Syzygium grande]